MTHAASTPLTEEFLAFASPENEEAAGQALTRIGTGNAATAWVRAQREFLDMTDRYLAAEAARPDDHLVPFHEAGGQWRIAFPHLHVRPQALVEERLRATIQARRAFTDEHYYLGYHDEHEIHHEAETFIYFQIPLLLHRFAGYELAREAVEQVAAHTCGDSDAPMWYDWSQHAFRSTWLGTRSVRNHPPYDYQEANHFRFVEVCLAAHAATGAGKPLDLAVDYADRWCDHIEHYAARGETIPCQILPEGARVEEAGKAGANTDESVYQIFYATVAVNTVYDIANALLDLYRLLGVNRYRDAAQALLDPFFEQAADGRPACRFQDGQWIRNRNAPDGTLRDWIEQWPAMLVRPALKFDEATGTTRYRAPLLAWADAVDETHCPLDQSLCDVMAAAHYWTGDTEYLQRGYAMALRLDAVCANEMGRHNGDGTNCNVTTRYGSRFAMELLYAPLLGGCDWGTRGGLPQMRLSFRPGGLPREMGFRFWRDADNNLCYEAVNDSRQATTCSFMRRKDGAALEPWRPATEGDTLAETLSLAPGGTVSGALG